MVAEEEKKLSELLSLSQAGDTEAYSYFLAQASSVLIPFIQRKVNNADFVDDILQDTLMAIHKARHTYLPGRSVAAWIYVICEHRVIDFYRKYRRVEKAEVPFLEGIDFIKQAEMSGSREDLLQIIETLPSKQRKIVEMIKIEGLSIKEVAVKMDMSESAVKVSAFRSYEALKRLAGVRKE